MPSFSERQGYTQPKGITFRDELPVKLRIPIFEILLARSIKSEFLWKRIKKLLNPYGTDDDWVEMTEAITAASVEMTEAITAASGEVGVMSQRERWATHSQRNGSF